MRASTSDARLIPPFDIGRSVYYPNPNKWHICLPLDRHKPICGTGRFVDQGLTSHRRGMPDCHKCIAAIRRSHGRPWRIAGLLARVGGT